MTDENTLQQKYFQELVKNGPNSHGRGLQREAL